MSAWVSSLGCGPRLDALGAVEGELLLLGLALTADGLEDDRVVVAGGEPLDDPPDEPVRQAGDDRAPLRPLGPLAPLELVDLVAGLAAEQLGDLLAVGRDEVHAEVLGALGDLEGVVLVRQPGQEARRVDADLRGEADEAAGALPVPGDRRDDEHRVVELAHERGERLDDVVGGGHVRGVLPALRLLAPLPSAPRVAPRSNRRRRRRGRRPRRRRDRLARAVAGAAQRARARARAGAPGVAGRARRPAGRARLRPARG